MVITRGFLEVAETFPLSVAAVDDEQVAASPGAAASLHCGGGLVRTSVC